MIITLIKRAYKESLPVMEILKSYINSNYCPRCKEHSREIANMWVTTKYCVNDGFPGNVPNNAPYYFSGPRREPTTTYKETEK